MDLRATEVTRGGNKVELSAKEFHLLKHLMEHPGETLSRDELLKEVWGYEERHLHTDGGRSHWQSAAKAGERSETSGVDPYSAGPRL
jgi:hypothetical protein